MDVRATFMDVLQEVQVDILEETLMDVLEEVQPLWTYLRKCNPYGRT